jgi:hypothetical protein
MINRNNCVLCINPNKNNKLISIHTIKSPYYLIENDNEWDMTYGYCINCYSVQLMTLLPPEIVYNGNKNILPYNINYNWIQHNISFVSFIISEISPDKSILEIGSSSFVLGKHLIEYYKKYIVFDISLEKCNKRNDVTYIEGNCENYKFDKNTNIVMSHVFEHLYEPQKFIENCKNSGVENIIISIPNMNNTDCFHITNQHTFLYNDEDIEYIFGNYNYKCVKKHFFNTNDNSFPCIFLSFTYCNTTDIDYKMFRIINDRRHLYTCFVLDELNKLQIPNNTFISTAGMFSYVLYSIIKNTENLIGVIDQNTNLKGHIYANTNLPIYSYEYLKNFDKTANIIIYQKNNDIINCIRKYNSEINIIIF